MRYAEASGFSVKPAKNILMIILIGVSLSFVAQPATESVAKSRREQDDGQDRS